LAQDRVYRTADPATELCVEFASTSNVVIWKRGRAAFDSESYEDCAEFANRAVLVKCQFAGHFDMGQVSNLPGFPKYDRKLRVSAFGGHGI
jgi:hypothetical protein